MAERSIRLIGVKVDSGRSEFFFSFKIRENAGTVNDNIRKN